ncbi:succinate dehydrogenase assembly factor 2 [Halovulum dunhuangense]|uniref:FAD assembly factor SdhE n=1 Tax=Halovulum dunhuangense TaxID=1505036 RepID=A0A849L3D0_9RHOB|nr:succinate dehydrogenase assembly factor 2 [Halovulum dunhuangense]NNU80819.1 succinate dehydrogenase assembly factor 2 [Halovulum dunhuangense]
MLSGTDTDPRLKRLSLRSWRRGTKEMDLILGPYSDARLAQMEPGQLAAFEALLEENDQDLYPWITGQQPGPEHHAALLREIRAFHGIAAGN